MTSSEIRASFLDFFRDKGHTIVPSSSLLPDAPNLLFTNAGMNQFVPIFLGQAPCPYSPARAADTQKCIRAGGKHNDLEDVGFDTYHHTFFEMLGNWSFGDYFKKEAIAWAWELVVGRWHFPASRIYATVYKPGPGDPASFDQEAYDHWAAVFTAAGLDPAIHIVNGNKKDNFWMMGDTGPCGPCSELHVDLTPGPRDLDLAAQQEGRKLVNSGDARCIEIWNLVFIQFNANPDGSFGPLPAKHVDTGMGFERVTSMIQGTKGFTDFSTNVKISNYETDVFRPIFDELEKLTGKKYTSTLPASAQNLSEQEKVDVAFRVIADHIRTLSFSIADGIQPSNEGRGYVLRRILRRAVRYGRNLGLREPFLGKLVAVLGTTMGHIFPEVVAKADLVRKTLTNEEESFFRTLERGIELFNNFDLALQSCPEILNPVNTHTSRLRNAINDLVGGGNPSALATAMVEIRALSDIASELNNLKFENLPDYFYTARASVSVIEDAWIDFDSHEKPASDNDKMLIQEIREHANILDSVTDIIRNLATKRQVPGEVAFRLYDTYGFPLDLTELMARERGLTVGVNEFTQLMEEQKARGRAAQKKDIIVVDDIPGGKTVTTEFVGFEKLNIKTVLQGEDVFGKADGRTDVFIVPKTPFYVAKGGQVGDIGTVVYEDKEIEVTDVTLGGSGLIYHKIKGMFPLKDGVEVVLSVDSPRRAKIEAHHSGTHLLNWALRKVLGNTITQKGSYVGPDRLRFDFSHGAAMTPAELAEVEKLVNEKIHEDVPVKWEERAYAEVKGDPSILQFFGDKYGDMVRVVSIGDFSRELCGGTHVRQSSKVGHFKILSEGAIAAGIRRIEAASGPALIEHVREQLLKQEEHLAALSQRKTDLGTLETFSGDETPHAFWKHWEAREAFLRQAAADVAQHEKDEAKRQEAAFQKRAATDAPVLIAFARTVNDVPFLAHNMVDANAAYLPVLADALKTRWQGVAVLAAVDQGKVALLAAVAPAYTKKVQAGKIIQAIAPLVGGKGGGRPELAQGGGTNPEGVAAALAKAEELVRAI